jgi:predicted ATPase/DNA-binding SARP family transcriptional activator
MDPRCRIELFGGVRVLQGDREITRFRTHKAAGLLSYLALFLGPSHPRDQLVDLFWPEMELDTGRDNLSTALSSLRRQLEPRGIPTGSVLLADRRHVQLNPATVSTDVAEFGRVLEAASRLEEAAERAALLEHAVGLYRGELLPGCDDEWALLERTRWSARGADALQQWAAALEKTGDLEGAFAAAQRAVQADPFREECYQAQMRLCAALGRPAAGLALYQKLERLLRDELGVSPAAATRELAERLRQDPSAVLTALAAPGAGSKAPHGAATPSETEPPASGIEPRGEAPFYGEKRHEPPLPLTLPLQLTRFFGREWEIEQLTRRLRQPETRLVTLTGPGGAGKTRLAIEVARRLAPEFQGRVWFVELAALPDPNLIPFAVAGALRLPPVPDRDPLEGVVETLRDAPGLLLLDNFEHLLRERGEGAKGERPTSGGTALVRLLLERASRLACLVTSRQPLHLGGEQEYPVPPLAVPDAPSAPLLERLVAFPSVALYADRAQLAKPDFALTDQNAAAVAILCRKLEGMPLAIEMAAAWAKLLPPVRMLERLQRPLELLVSRRRDLPARHQSLRATIEWSYELLSPELQACFARLAVFRGGWSLEAAEAVCGDAALGAWRLALGESDRTLPSAKCQAPSAGVLDLLMALVDKSLVLAEEQGEEIRYRMLEPLREYALERLVGRKESKVVRERHAAYLLALAEEARSNLRGPEMARWLDRLTVEHDNLRAALECCRAAGAEDAESQGMEIGLRLAAALYPFWGYRGYRGEGRAWLERMLACGSPRTTARARALIGAGSLAREEHDGAVAQARLEESLAIMQDLGDRHGIAAALLELALVMGDRGEADTARALSEESLALMRERGDRAGISQNLCNLGHLALLRGDESEARRLWEESRAIDQALGTWDSYALCGLGDLAIRRGDYAEAQRLRGEVLRERQEIGYEFGVAVTLENLAWLAAARAEPERAVRLWAAAAARREALGARPHPRVRAEHHAALSALRATLGEEAFGAAFDEGQRLTRDEAVTYALQDGG